MISFNDFFLPFVTCAPVRNARESPLGPRLLKQCSATTLLSDARSYEETSVKLVKNNNVTTPAKVSEGRLRQFCVSPFQRVAS